MLRSLRLAAALGALAGAGCAVNSDDDCRSACAWWGRYCTGESVDSCVSDCRESTESASAAVSRCVEGGGWSTPSSCRSASCCVRWVYGDYAYRQQCLP